MKSLSVTVFALWRSGSAPFLFDQCFRFEIVTEIVASLVRDSNFHRLRAFVSGGRVEVQAIAAGAKIRATVFALIRDLNLLLDLELGCTIIAASDQNELRFNAARSAPGARRRLGFALLLAVQVSTLTILSTHLFSSKASIIVLRTGRPNARSMRARVLFELRIVFRLKTRSFNRVEKFILADCGSRCKEPKFQYCKSGIT